MTFLLIGCRVMVEVGGMDWLDKFLRYHMCCKINNDLNHSPILLTNENFAQKRYPFKFEVMWITHPNLENTIEQC